MKNILLIIPYGSVGGMERLAKTFYNYFINQGHNVKVLKLINLQDDIINFGQDEIALKKKDFNAMSLMERLIFYFVIPFKIRSVIKKNNITHSISYGDMANLFSSLTFTSEFKVGSIHALKSVELLNKNFLNIVFKISYRSTHKFFTKLVCISRAIQIDLIENCNYRFSNLDLIYNPHNVKEIFELSKEIISDPEEKKIFANDTILFLGRLSIQKSPWHLIKAFSLVLNEKPNTNLVFIGDGDILVQRAIEDLVEKFDIRNNVFLLGRRENPYKYIAVAKVLALSSHYEGTPNVIVESICIGTPIVSSLCTLGISELMGTTFYKDIDTNISVEAGIITPNLFKGILGIPSNNKFIKEEGDFAKGLIDVIMNKDIKMRLLENKEVLLSKFKLDVIANQYLNKSV